MTYLEVCTVEICKGELLLKRQLRHEVSVTSFLVSYSMFNNEVFCLASQNDINRRELAIFSKELAQFQHIDFDAVIGKTHLSSDILKDDGFTCWSPIQMESCDVPIFVVAFGCKMRFRSFYRYTKFKMDLFQIYELVYFSGNFRHSSAWFALIFCLRK